jgi:protein SCO1/2
MKPLQMLPLLIVLLFSCKNKSIIKLPYFNQPDFTPVWLNKKDAAYKTLHTIPSFSFTDQHGKVISRKTTDGKIYIANFFFTRCENICPRMMGNLKKAAEAFAKDTNVVIISHSVTPLYDSPLILNKYAAEKNITNPNWHLVTGNRDEIYHIARQGYFADNVSGSSINSQFLHTENLILVDKNRHIRGVYNGTLEFEVANLIRHIKLLEEED